MITVTLYHVPTSSESKEIVELFTELEKEIPHELVTVDISKDRELWEGYQNQHPVVEVGPFTLRYPFTLVDLRVAIGAASDRMKHLVEVGDTKYSSRYERARQLTRTDIFSLWLANWYIWVFNGIVLLFVGLPFLAPVFMRGGLTLPANIIYKIYSPLCHQFAFRSWFLFGEQGFYPRELAGMDNVLSYEEITHQNGLDLLDARDLVGNEQMGYKVALCQRDVAIYAGILLFGLLFAVTGRKIRSIPWYVWVLVGILPMGLDGASQLPSLTSLNLPVWIPLRESTPFLRTLTGALFGVTTAWYGYPMIEETMQETKRILFRKQAIVAVSGKEK